MAAVVVFCTVYALILPAITMEGAYACGIEEHTHSADECYETRLVCALAEGEAPVHTHDESCYEERSVLVCSLAEDGETGHVHDESCYEAQRELICGLTEGEAAGEPHVHGEDCYETVLICPLAEHTHTEECIAAQEESAEPNDLAPSENEVTDSSTPEGGFMGYVNNMNVQKTVTGSAPFDSDDNPGNDSSENNNIIRTFDTIKYDVEASFESRTKDSMVPQSSELQFEISMDKKITEARFDISTMPWLDTGGTTWEIEYWAERDDGEEYVALKERKDGTGSKLYRDNGSGNFAIETSINAMVLGSNPTEAEGTAYQTSTGGIIRQSLKGTVTVLPNGEQASGNQTFSTGVRVLNANSGTEFTPSFKAWFTNNPDNYGEIVNGTSEKSENNQTTASAVKVSCAPMFNLMLKESTEYVNYLSWYDFSSNDEVKDANLLAYLEAAGSLEENYGEANPSDYTYAGSDDVAAMYNALTAEQKASLANIRYGRMNALGITMSLASEASPGTNKGYKGCSLPVGDITFDLALGVTTNVTEVGDDVRTDGYSAILWDYRPNVTFNSMVDYPEANKTRGSTEPSVGNMNRNLLWRGIEFSQYGSRMAVGAYRGTEGDGNTTVYDSGEWELTKINGADAERSTADSANSVYTFKLSDYDFDFDSYLFPDRFYGASAADGKLGVTDFAFFGGFAQVLYVMPYANYGVVDVKRSLTVGNMEATDLSNQSLTLAEGAERGKTVKADNEKDAGDNTVASAITQYSVGEFTKRNSFNTVDAYNHTQGTNGKSFLGSEFWGSPQWDENYFAGGDISIMGSVQLSTASDNSVRAVNLLQLFDSEALSITPKSEVITPETDAENGASYITQDKIDFGNFYENTYEGHNPEVKYLFAADPGYPDGYDTNTDGVVPHMNLVRYDDLVYADKLYWNDAEQCYNIVKFDIDGDEVEEEFTCVGVLSEVRGCNYIDYCYVRIPVTVADDPKFVSTTVCTVNAAEAWIDAGAMDGVSWLSGNWDPETRKNTLEGYEPITFASNSDGNGYYLYNNEGSYTKIEYDENGGHASGHAGKKEGASLLILGYKAKVNITHQKYLEPGQNNNYSPGGGDSSVTWIVTDIATEVGTTQGTPDDETTSLTIPVDLTYQGGAKDAQQQDLFYITANSSTITELVWETNENGELILDENGNPKPVYETDEEGNPILDADNNPIQKTVVKTVSSDPGSPTTITFLGTYTDENNVTRQKLYSYTIYAEINAAQNGITYRLDNAPVGQVLPNISFNMNLGASLLNHDQIMATAAISGEGDKRAYSETAGNRKAWTVGMSKLGGSELSKSVDIAYGEINATMKYTVTFTNTSENSLTKAYFYDNLPYNSDGRGSTYDMGEDGTTTDGTIVKEISFRSLSNGELTGDFQATVTVYYPRGEQDNAYSKMNDLDFKNLMYGFEKYNSSGAEIIEEGADDSTLDALLKSNQFNVLMTSEGVFVEDENGMYYKLAASLTEDQRAAYSPIEYNGEYYTKTAPSDNDAANYASPTTKYKRTASYHRTLAATLGWLTYDGNGAELWAAGPITTDSGNTYTDGKAAYEAFLSTIPGVVVKIENMGPMRSIEMEIQFATSNNKARDVYSNDAWQWTVGSMPLHSNTVQTVIVGRTISGLVWDDKNLNGRYDDGESPINDVTCTLFKWDDSQQEYVPCTVDVAGRPIGAVTSGSYDYTYTRDGTQLTVDAYKNTLGNQTFYRDSHGHVVDVTADQNNDGKYSFDALPEGRYIVAFSGEALEHYGGATGYQVDRTNNNTTNDGVALFSTPGSNLDTEVTAIAGFTNDGTYKYAIAYNLTENAVDSMELHSVDAIVSGNLMTNSVELIDRQDLGLVSYAGYQLPNTGGAGGELYAIGGVALMTAAAVLLLYMKSKRRKEDPASS